MNIRLFKVNPHSLAAREKVNDRWAVEHFAIFNLNSILCAKAKQTRTKRLLLNICVHN